jgi:hypothetical protein
MSARDHFRAHGRQRVDLEATLLDHDGNARGVTIRDLGLGGAGLELPDPDPTKPSADLILDAQVVLELATPNLWDPLRLHGTVAWVRRNAPTGRRTRAGIRFEHRDAPMLLSLFQVLTT